MNMLLNKKYRRLEEIENGWTSTRRSDQVEADSDKEYKSALETALWKKVNAEGTIYYDDKILLDEFGDENIKEAIRKRCTYQIVGLRSEKYRDIGPSGSYEELERNIICCKNGDRKYEIALYTAYDYDATHNIVLMNGTYTFHEVSKFERITVVPREKNASFEFLTDCHDYSPYFRIGYRYYTNVYGDIEWNGKPSYVDKSQFIEIGKAKRSREELQIAFSEWSVEDLKNVLGEAIVENKCKKAELEKRQAVENKLKEANLENRQLEKNKN